MSRRAIQHLSCPACGARVEWTIHSSVNVTQDRALKLRVLQNDLGRFRCPHCGAEALLSQPLLYHDMDLHLMIQLAPQPDFNVAALNAALDRNLEASGQLTTRLVRTWNDLREKVLLFDAKLDDRAVEVLKALARQQHTAAAADLFFEEQSGEELYFTVLGGDQPLSIAVTLQMYQAIRAQLKRAGLLESDGGRWAVIDRAYSEGILEKLAREPLASA